MFTLCHVAEHSTAEVSQALGLSEATVRVHLFRAVRKLRKLLGTPEAQANERQPARTISWLQQVTAALNAEADAAFPADTSAAAARPDSAACRSARPSRPRHRLSRQPGIGCRTSLLHDHAVDAMDAPRPRRSRSSPASSRASACRLSSAFKPHGARWPRRDRPAAEADGHDACALRRRWCPSDDEFLGEVEIAAQSRPAALRHLDALTPRAWDVEVGQLVAGEVRTDGAVPPLIFRKGLDLKHEVAARARRELPQRSRHHDQGAGLPLRVGRLTVHLAREFGFCYGVDRAVDYAYQARHRFGDRRVLSDRRNHPQPARQRSAARAGHPVPDRSGRSRSNELDPDDVVILPAFGVTIELLQQLERRGCTLVDTTCGSVLNVWKNVKRYADDGFTSIIHGKYWHEETQATASQARRSGRRHYLVVLDKAEAGRVCDYIRHGGDRAAFLAAFEPARLGGLRSRRAPAAGRLREPDDDAQLRVARDRRDVPRRDPRALRRSGAADALPRLRHDLQRDAGSAGRRAWRCSPSSALDLMIVIGGYNSSNTFNLARICAGRLPTFHIADPGGLLSADEMRHRPIGSKQETTSPGWLPAGPMTVGLTVGRVDAGQSGRAGHPAPRRARERVTSGRHSAARVHVAHVRPLGKM